MRQLPQLTLIAAACTTLILTACGGGGGETTASASSSTVLGTSTASGTVTGFGSVIVDGVRIDDSAVAASSETEDDSARPAEIRIGQHVEVEHDGSNVARSIRISAELEGMVTAIDTATGTISVLGQRATINTDPTLGPVTVFETPYQGIADVAVNDAVEIHGLIKLDATGKSYIQATRVEKKNSANANRVRGIVTALSTTAKTFRVGDLLVSYVNANVTPTSRTLKDGDEVAVWIPLNATSTGGAINATKVKIRDRRGVSQEHAVHVGGAVSGIDATAKTFTVNGVRVDASQAQFTPTGKTFADIADGTYVRVQGTFMTDGTLRASGITLRALEQGSGREVELHGSILNFQSAGSFMVRGLNVDASSARITCPATTSLANDLQVEVEGRLTAPGRIIATEVVCENTQDGRTVMEREGVASAVNATAKTFAIGMGAHGTMNVQWSDTTLFVGVTAATLDGKRVEVEGVMSAGVFRAAKVKLDS